MIVRPWAGKNADPVAADLKAASRARVPDVVDARTEVVAARKEVDISDGWAHGGDDSLESIWRELHGMISGDKHERLMEAIDQEMPATAGMERDLIEEKIAAAGGPGIQAEVTEVFTEREMQARTSSLKKGKPHMEPTAFELQLTMADRLERYG